MKSPAFRFYPADFIGSPDVQSMDLHEVGAYIYLLCMAWQSDRHGYLPNDDEKLRRWAHMNREQWSQSRDLLLSKFPVVEDGWRANPRMVHEAEKQATFSDSQRNKANRRWGKSGFPQQCREDADADAGAMPGHIDEDAGGMPSVSVFNKNKDISVPPEPHPEAALAGNEERRPQLVTINTKQAGKQKRSQGNGYDPRFLSAYELYPKHEEKSASEVEWQKANRRLQKGEKNKPAMTEPEAAGFIEKAVADFAAKMADRDLQYIRSMRRWLHDSNYLDYEPKPKAEYQVLTPEEAQAQWEAQWGGAANHA